MLPYSVAFFAGVNDLVPAENLAYLLKYDSTHGRFDGTVEADEMGLVVDGKHVACMSERDPGQLPWGETGADYVIEATGLFTKGEDAHRHIRAQPFTGREEGGQVHVFGSGRL
jgi:glyceraldehyde 3-phosphate dehydrogenase